MYLLLFFYFFTNLLFADGIIGYYQLPKNKRGIESIVRIFENEGRYYAYGFASKNDIDAGLDELNPNKNLRSRPIKGLVFMWNLQADDTKNFSGGRIYNYINGKTYYLRAELRDTNLIIKASVDSTGLFGKTFEWKKLSLEEVAEYLSQEIPLDDVKKFLPN